MLPDLVANRITALTVIFDPDEFRVSHADPLFPQMQAIGGRQNEGQHNVVFMSQYKASNRIQHMTLGLTEDEAGRATLALHARIGGSRTRRLHYESVETAMEYLGRLRAHGTAHSYILYEVPSRSFKPLIPLPLRIAQEGVLPFDRLMGFRVGRLVGSQENRSLIVDLAGSSLQLSLTFVDQFDIDERLLGNVLKSSKDLVIPLLTRSKEVEQWYRLGVGG